MFCKLLPRPLRTIETVDTRRRQYQEVAPYFQPFRKPVLAHVSLDSNNDPIKQGDTMSKTKIVMLLSLEEGKGLVF